MKEHSKVAWGIAARYSYVLASETRDLAAHIDAAIAIERERCAVIAERFYLVTVAPEHEHARGIGETAGKQIAEAIRDLGQGALK